MSGFTATLIMLSSITVFARVRVGKQSTVSEYRTVDFGHKPSLEELVSELNTLVWSSQNVAIVDMDAQAEYKLTDLDVKAVSSIQEKYDTQAEIANTPLTRLQVIKTVAGPKVFSSTMPSEALTEYKRVSEYGYRLVYCSCIIPAMIWRDISRADGLVILSDSTRVVLYSSKAIREFKFDASYSAGLDDVVKRTELKREVVRKALRETGCWNTPGNADDLQAEGLDPAMFFEAVEESLVKQFAAVSPLISKVRSQKETASLELCGPASEVEGLSRKLNQTPFTINDRHSLGIEIPEELLESSLAMQLQRVLASIRDNIANFHYEEALEEAELEDTEGPVIIGEQEPEPGPMNVEVDLSKIKPRRSRRQERLILDTGRTDKTIAVIEDSLRLADTKKSNMASALMFFGIVLVVVGMIGMLGSRGTSQPQTVDIKGLEAQRDELVQSIDAQESYRQVADRQIDKYLPYIEYVGGEASSEVSISDLNLIGDASLLITGSCDSKDSYSDFEQGLRRIDTGLSLVVLDRTETSDGITFRFEVTRGG